MFSKSKRQEIIDQYLAETGENMFVPARFVDWLEDKPDHPCWQMWHGVDAEDAKRKWMIDQVRRFTSDLRIVVTHSEIVNSNVKTITTREFPAYISPMTSRSNGGGYVRFDPRHRETLDELKAQAAASLRMWLSRYRGAAEEDEIDVSGIERIVDLLAPAKAA